MELHKTIHKALLLIALILTGGDVMCQSLSFKALTVNDGLSQHDVSCILQDSYGFIWIGTYDGLNRYDGYKVKNYYSESDKINSISSNRITTLFEDSQKRLWIGTDGEGLNVYDLQTGLFKRIKTPENHKLINHIIETDKEGILIATSNGVLRVTEEKDNITTELLQLPLTGMIINKMAIHGERIFFATNNGLWFMENAICKQVPGVKTDYIEAITVDSQGQIWIGDTNYLAYLTRNQDSYSITETAIGANIIVRSLAATNNNTLWIGTIKKGLFKYNTNSNQIIEHITSKQDRSRKLLTNSILFLYIDNSNILWVANREGVCFASLSPKKFNQLYYNIDSLTNHVRTLMHENNSLYIGLQNNGCFHYDLASKKIQRLNVPESMNPYRFYNFNNSIYLVSNIGLFKSTGQKNNFIQQPIITKHDNDISTIISAMCQDKDGNFYYGTYTGLIIQKNSTTDWIHYLYDQGEDLRNKRIFSLLYDEPANCIWAGTISHGIYKINLSAQYSVLSIEKYSTNMLNGYQIANNTIWCFYKDQSGHIWAGTDAGLLKKNNDSNTFHQVKTKGVVDRKIMAIIEGNPGKLWLSNSQGIIHYMPDSQKVEIYSYNDGLTTSTFTEAVDKNKDGTIFFGSIDGINYFHPSEIKPNKGINEVFITDFKVHNSSVEAGDLYMGSQLISKSINAASHVDIRYKQNNFTFEFAGTNFINAEENEFRYRLDGYEDNWLYTNGKHRFASYSNLPAGSYTFIVEAANHDEIWSNNPCKINLTVYPAPWQTWWAYMGYFFIIFLLITVFGYFWHNRQKLKHRIQIDQIHHKKEQEIHELKLMFFTDVAHEFKTPLSLVIGPLNDLMRNNSVEESRDFCFQVISRNTQRMMVLVNQLLDFRKIDADINILHVGQKNLTEFIQQITRAFLWQAENENIHFNILTPEKLICYFDPDIIEKVLYNVISNAFQHTPKNGIIELELKPVWKNNLLFANIIIRDSGKGIPDEEKNKIFERYFHGKNRYSSGIGLHLSYALIKAHKGEINVADSIYGGAEFILSIPATRDSFTGEEMNFNNSKETPRPDIFAFHSNTKIEVSEERERVLIVEDDHDLRNYLRNCLQSTYLVTEAGNGRMGIEMAQKELPDIIVSDVMMPEMDGVEMCIQLKASIETSHIPILLLTAKTDEDYQKQGLDAGAWDYITKPFNTSSLLKKIKNIIETRNKYKEHLLNHNITLNLQKHYTTFDQKVISKVTETIEKHISDSDYSVEDLALEIGLSRMQLHRKLKCLSGQSTTGFINTIKITHAKNLFDKGCDRIQEAMDVVGINSYSHFNSTFKKVVGSSPSEYITNRNKTNP